VKCRSKFYQYTA